MTVSDIDDVGNILERNGGDHLSAVIEFFHGTPGPFRTYANPMRSDSVFIGRDKPTTYYEHPDIFGNLKPEAVPRNSRTFPYQVPHDVAERAVAILNKEPTAVARFLAGSGCSDGGG